MSKRGAPQEPLPGEERPRASGTDSHGATVDEEGMGEFEDPYEDEIESDEGEVVDADEDDGEMDVDGEIERLDEEEEDENASAKARQTYLPGAPLPEGQTLVPDQSAYDMLHRMNVTWPCLSFDFLRDNLGTQRQTFPHSAYFVAGTQADVAKNNEVMVMKASSMHRTSRDDGKFLSQQRRACDDVLRHLAKSFCLCRQHTRYLSYTV